MYSWRCEWLPTRIELKGWGVWRKIRETGITVDQARSLAGQVKAITPINHHEKFDWEMTDKDQGYFDLKMMVFLCFKDGVTLRDRRIPQMDIYQALQSTPVEIRGVKVRAMLELDPSKRPWQKASAIFFSSMKEHANLDAETFDFRWVTMGLRVDVNCAARGVMPSTSQLASFTIGGTGN